MRTLMPVWDSSGESRILTASACFSAGWRMRRRDLITFVGGAVAWPLAGYAQQRPMQVVGFLRNMSRDDSTRLISAFQQGLKLGGYIEGENVTIVHRWADNQVNRHGWLK